MDSTPTPQLTRRSTMLLVGFVVAMLVVTLAVSVGRPLGVAGVEPRSTGTVLDINTVDAAGLALLSGIGPSLAQRIVEHREATGGFTSVEQLLEVRGIGPVTLERVRQYVVCGLGETARHEPR